MNDNIIYIYTDGSCRNKDGLCGGIGIVLKYKEHEKHISKGQYTNTTSARMELHAILESLKSITNKNLRVELYGDNQYTIFSVSKGWVLNWEAVNYIGRKNADLWKQILFEIRQFPKGYIKFNWVRGHNNHRENEICDKLAAKGGGFTVLIDDSVC